MLELFRKNMHLYVKVLMNLRIPIKYQNKVFDVNEKTELLLTDEVMAILTKNGNIKLWNGNKFIKLNLGQFYDVIQNNNYTIVDYVEPKVEVKPPVVKKEEPKVEVKPPEVKKEEIKVEIQSEVKKEEPKEEVVEQPEVKKEEPKKEVKQYEAKNQQKHDNKQNEHNENKKQRHNNNNNKQGGGK